MESAGATVIVREVRKAPSVRPPAPVSAGRGDMRTPPNLIREVLAEGQRAPPIPKSRREFELRKIREIVARLSPTLSDDERQELEIAAGKAEQAGISPKTEFIAHLRGLFPMVLEAYAKIETHAA
ncbi:MAG: hypothetical protein AB1657_02340 [Candidatus Micrarchaeota archaeon]